MKTKAVIIDLDGTLCNNSHRQHFMEKSPKDWKGFYGGIANDEPHLWCADLVRLLQKEGYPIIYLSGRPEEYRQVSEDWIQRHNLDNHYALFMRKTGDFREDYVVKEEIYKEKILPHHDILFAVDDRKQVVDMWRRNGITCLQCAEGNFTASHSVCTGIEPEEVGASPTAASTTIT